MQSFKITAIQGEKSLEHFGIHPMTASLYGHKESEIITVTMKVADDQTRPEGHDNNKPDYWGWLDSDKQEFSGSLIWPQYFLLNMCFPAGIKATEEAGQGQAVRLEVVI